jgi:hypothetical protein
MAVAPRFEIVFAGSFVFTGGGFIPTSPTFGGSAVGLGGDRYVVQLPPSSTNPTGAVYTARITPIPPAGELGTTDSFRRGGTPDPVLSARIRRLDAFLLHFDVCRGHVDDARVLVDGATACGAALRAGEGVMIEVVRTRLGAP